MSSKTIVGRHSWSKTVLILAIVSLCCFMFAGVALAGGGQLNIIPDLNNPNPKDSVKASHTYDYVFDAEGFTGVDVQSLYQDPQDLFITFPTVASGDATDQFDLTPATGRTVPVKVTVSGVVYNMQIVPTIDNANHRAIFDFQSANLTKTGWVDRIEILGLRVKNTHIPSDSYKIEFSHYQPFLFTIYKSIRVVETVGEITIDSPKTCANIKAGGSFEVKGRVIGTCNKPWDYTSWPVKIEILDKKGRPAIIPVQNVCPTYTEDGRPIGEEMKPVCTSAVVGATETTFTATLKMPGYPYKYNGVWTNDYVIKASTVEVKDAYSIPVGVAPAESIEDYADTTLVGCPIGDSYAYLGIRHWFCDFTCDDIKASRAIALSLPETIHMIPAEPVKLRMVCPPAEIKLNAPVELTICLTDKYCNDAPAVKQEKIDLAALQDDNGGNMAGIFYDAAGNQISHVYVPIGQSCVTVVFRPTLVGPIVIEARAENLTSTPSEIVKAICFTKVIDGDQMSLDLIAKVTDENGDPRAGWPVKGAYWIMPVGATQDYKVHVEITDCNGNFYNDLNKNGMYDVGEEVATWGLDPGNIQFGAKGPYRGHNICNPWDTVPHVFCTTKQHIWIYPNISIQRCKTDHGYLEPVINYPDCLRVKVVVEGPAGTTIMTVEGDTKNFVNPVELMRSLNAEAWQTLSTPKTLAGTGDLKFLIGDSYLAALTYRNGKWDQLLPGEELQPLYCYYVKMKQPKMPGETSEECYWNAAYIFDRATDPSQMIPPVRTLGIGWQAVGMAVQDAVKKHNEDPLWQQQDYLYRALGTICKCCKIVYNPGFPKVENPHYPNLDRTRLGNLANFQTVAVSQGTSGAWWDDPYAVVYNGDNYWVYLCETQDLAANVGLEVVDP
ncbi:MAG TPA: hypothetical protein DD719_00505 [Desulfotomaculum sp.]|nr:hypothetical protein [Desulfotomaculum sp.]HCJ79730.1 hypothetical protein [Desulfotomaculum sp.]